MALTKKVRNTQSGTAGDSEKREGETCSEKAEAKRGEKEAPVNDMLQNFEKRFNEMLQNFEKKNKQNE